MVVKPLVNAVKLLNLVHIRIAEIDFCIFLIDQFHTKAPTDQVSADYGQLGIVLILNKGFQSKEL